MENIRDLIAVFGQKALAGPGRIHEVIKEHQTIIKALKRKNKQEAAESIKYHLAATEKSLTGKILNSQNACLIPLYLISIFITAMTSSGVSAEWSKPVRR